MNIITHNFYTIYKIEQCSVDTVMLVEDSMSHWLQRVVILFEDVYFSEHVNIK